MIFCVVGGKSVSGYSIRAHELDDLDDGALFKCPVKVWDSTGHIAIVGLRRRRDMLAATAFYISIFHSGVLSSSKKSRRTRRCNWSKRINSSHQQSSTVSPYA